MEKQELQKLRDLPIEGVAERLGLQVSRHKCLCPFHDDHHASLSFSVSTNRYRCFVCGASGGSIDLVMHLLNKDFKDACRWLADANNILVQERPQPAAKLGCQTPTFDPTRYARFFENPILSEPARQFLFEERKLDEYIIRLEACKGEFIIQPLNNLADKLAFDLADISNLADDDDVWDMGKRAIVSAWKNGCILYILNGQCWTRAMGEFVEWLVYHDLWSKMQIFGDLLKIGDTSTSEAGKFGPRNMLEDLGDTFTEADLEALRANAGKPKDGTKRQLAVWVSRHFIEFSPQTGLYSKTKLYLNRKR